MGPDKKPGPAASAGPGTNSDTGSGARISIGQQLRRRREASLRLGPYSDGPADPLDEVAAARCAWQFPHQVRCVYRAEAGYRFCPVHRGGPA